MTSAAYLYLLGEEALLSDLVECHIQPLVADGGEGRPPRSAGRGSGTAGGRPPPGSGSWPADSRGKRKWVLLLVNATTVDVWFRCFKMQHG